MDELRENVCSSTTGLSNCEDQPEYEQNGQDLLFELSRTLETDVTTS